VQQNTGRGEQTLETIKPSLLPWAKCRAAVSHELNQPLAGNETYLAGGALLMQRNSA